jgi:hypothetical protein
MRILTAVAGGLGLLLIVSYLCNLFGVFPRLFSDRNVLIGLGVLVVVAIPLGIKYGTQYKEWWY